MKEAVVHGHSGAAARATAIFNACAVEVRYGEVPTDIIGQSSGAILAALQGAAYEHPEVLIKAIEMANTLDVEDMFPYEDNFPFKKGDKISANAAFRVATGHNHLAWQDIGPMFRDIYKEKHLKALKRSGINCYVMGVRGKNGTVVMHRLNDANSVEEVLLMLKDSNRIVPVTQAHRGNIDGGYACYNPAWLLFDQLPKIKKLRTFYAKELPHNIPENTKWDKSPRAILIQTVGISTHWLAIKDAMIEEYHSKLHGIDYIRVECPNGYTDEIYETDDCQLTALGNASRAKALKVLGYQTKDDILT